MLSLVPLNNRCWDVCAGPAVRCEFFVHYIVTSYCSCELGQAAAQPWLGLRRSHFLISPPGDPTGRRHVILLPPSVTQSIN